ncbi:MAG: nuclear transport factor 2 family protein [Limisphaerales bacterium]
MNASQTFIRSLQESEQSHNPEPLLRLFADQCTLTRLNSDEPYNGRDGAKLFWDEYLGLFREIRSRFTNVIESGNTAVLEWDAEGRFETGEPIHYRGVSIVEFDGDKVRKFRTYYDSAPFTQHAHA